MKQFKEFTDEELDEFERLRDKYFYAWDCWNAGCDCVNESCCGNYEDADYDEILFCDYYSFTKCPMFEIWKNKDKEECANCVK